MLCAVRMVTQLWLRMCPEQVRWTCTHRCGVHVWLLSCSPVTLQVQKHPVLQCTLQLLLSISAVLVKNVEPQVIHQVCFSLIHIKHNRDFLCWLQCVSGSDVCGCSGVSEVCRSAAPGYSGVSVLLGEDLCPSWQPGNKTTLLEIKNGKTFSRNSTLPYFLIHFVPQSQILPRLSSQFGVLLGDTSWLLHQHALEAFSHFAEVWQKHHWCH